MLIDERGNYEYGSMRGGLDVVHVANVQLEVSDVVGCGAGAVRAET